MTHGIVVVTAIVGLLTLAERAGDVSPGSKHDLDHDLAPARHPVVHVSATIESDRAADRIPVLPRANLLGFDRNSTDPNPPFTCMQLLVIDELELLGEAADCD